MVVPYKKGFTLGGIVILLVAFLISLGNLFEDLDASHIMVIQMPFTGNLKVYSDPGLAWQGFGNVTKYARRAQYSFNKGCAKADPNAFPPQTVRFHDGGHADLCGSISWEMPLDPKQILRLHMEFGSEIAIERQLLGKAIDSAAYTSGPMMSSTESSGARRTELFAAINDQTLNGLYETRVETMTRIDPTTKAEIATQVNRPVLDAKGQPKRIQGSAVAGYGITLLPLTISAINYDKVVESQIQQRQVATTQVEISTAKSRQAEQEAIQAEQEGRKAATVAKWKQETENAAVLAKAEQAFKSQELATKTADLYKKEQILKGEGDAGYKRAVMEADGALDPKLKAYVEVNAKYADAIQKYAGQWTPSVQMGSSGNSAGPGGAAMPLIDMLTAKTAKELGIDMTIGGKGATVKK